MVEKVKIALDNVYATLSNNIDVEVERKIYDTLMYTQEEFGSDNIEVKRLYNPKNKKTYTGLVPYVTDILDKYGIEYEFIDNRNKHEPNADFKLKEEIKLRPYQQKIVDRATGRDTIQAATGAGKTLMMAAMIAKFNVKPVAVFADKLALCHQIKDEFEKFLGVKVGIVGGGQRDVQDITVYSIQSANEEDVKDVKMIMFDECLSYSSKVLMEDGSYEQIGKLVDEKSTKKVMSFNHQTQEIEPKQIISHSKTSLKQNDKKLMKLTIRKSDGELETIECTDNHKIWVESLGQYVYARDLVKGQTVKTLNTLNTNKN